MRLLVTWIMKIAQMASLVMNACRLEEKSGAIYARELRNAKMLSTGPGRGSSAPDMSARDLATFLIALLATEKPTRAVSLTQRFGAMQLSAPQNWEIGSEMLPANPDHTLLEIMEALCNPKFRVPSGVLVEFTGTAFARIWNEDIEIEDDENGDRRSRSYLYSSREDMRALLERWKDVPEGDYESDLAKEAMAAAFDSPHSLHGLVTSRRISATVIETIKTFMFPEDYRDKLRELIWKEEDQ